VAKEAASARPLLWTFNVIGTLDLLAAVALATLYGVWRPGVHGSGVLDSGVLGADAGKPTRADFALR
jgi:hypothetical protein